MVLTVIGVVIILCCNLYAQFWDSENLTNIGSLQTGNTLSKNEKKIHLTGEIEYGISDRLMVGCDVMLMLFEFVNATAKFMVLKKTQSGLAVSLYITSIGGGGIQKFADMLVEAYPDYIESIYAKMEGTFLGIGMSKSFRTNTFFHCSAGAGTGEFKWEVTYKPDAEEIFEGAGEMFASIPDTNVELGLEHRFSKRFRAIATARYDIDNNSTAVNLGIIWATGRSFRIEIGTSMFAFYWRY